MLTQPQPTHVHSWSDLVSNPGRNPFAHEFQKRMLVYKQQIADDPENPELWTQFGNLCRRHGHIREMVTAYAKAIHLFAQANQPDRVVCLSRVLATIDAYDIRTRAAERSALQQAEVIPLR